MVFAARTAAADDTDAVQIHAFVSQGGLLSTHNNIFADTTDGSFEFFEAGLNLSKQLTPDLTVTMQLFARDLGPIGDYKPKFDFAYFDYHWRDWLGLRAGRIKLPYGLYNDVADIDAARATILLPQALYPLVDRDFLLAQTGFELYGFHDFDSGGALQYRAYGGTIYDSSVTTPGLTIPYIAGARVVWETPLTGLRVAANVNRLKVKLDEDALHADAEATIPIGSIEYEVGDLTLSGEYSRWYTRVHSNDAAVVPDLTTTSERGYLQAAYHVTPWFEPAAYYALLYPDISHRDGRDGRNADAAVSVRFDMNRFWIVKFEAHYERGTAGLDPTLNDGTPTGQLAETWLLFAAKTTVYF
ncbi:MAG TPA: hypothetical protein VGM88_15975 [Kofleriaceae bacterium]